MDINEKFKKALEEIDRLRKENLELKSELSQYKQNVQNSSSNGLVTNFSSPKDKLSLYMSLFRGRNDVYAKRWISKSGRPGFSPACGNEWDNQLCQKPKIKCIDCKNQAFSPLTPKVIYNHLSGTQTVGIYPLLKSDESYFLAIDFDKQQWKKDVQAFHETCHNYNIPCYVERSQSGQGAHAWFFFNKPVKASLARKFGIALLSKTGERRFEVGLDSYDRMFPNQDILPKGGFGNLIALPLQKEARTNGNSVFVNEKFEEIKDQWKYMSSIRKLDKKDISKFLNEITDTNLSIDKENIESSVALPKNLDIELKNGVYIHKNLLPNKILHTLQKLSSFGNPEFFKAEAKRFSTHRIPRMINCSEVIGEKLILPRGAFEDIKSLFKEQNTRLNLVDNQQQGDTINVKFLGKLLPQQEEAVSVLTSFNNGVLAADTGFGKTVTAAAIIAYNKINTLVIVHRTQLIDQWKGSLSTFLDIPIQDIGQIGAGKKNPSGKVDIATIQSLYRNGELNPEITRYGQIIVDECHHISALTFEKVLKAVRAKNVYGLTATPTRKDGLHPIIYMQCGPIRYKTNSKKQATIRPFHQTLIIRETKVETGETDIQSVYSQLISDKQRNDMIFNDVLQALEEKRSPIILTERIEHIADLHSRFKGFAKNIIILSGAMKNKERQEAFQKMVEIPDDEERLLIATGKYIGEGFDDPRLDSLFLTMPISWKGTLQQYVGRLHRNHTNKKEVKVYDYADIHVPMLKKMFDKRTAGYKSLGYKTEIESKTSNEQMRLF